MALLFQISQGLNQIHENKLIHKDFHIGNILSRDSGCVISDFGLSSLFNTEVEKKGKIFGVLPYIAPELLRSKSSCFTPASDIYAFAMIAYEILTNVRPHFNKNWKDDKNTKDSEFYKQFLECEKHNKSVQIVIQDISQEVNLKLNQEKQNEINLLESKLDSLKISLNEVQKLSFSEFVKARKEFIRDEENEILRKKMKAINGTMKKDDSLKKLVKQINKYCDEIVRLGNEITTIDIEIEYEDFEESLIIENYPNLTKIEIADTNKVEKLTLKNLLSLENCSITNCKLEKLVIENCPKLSEINVRNNSLIELEFTKNLNSLIKLEVDGNKEIVSGISEEESNRRELLSLKEENKKLEIKNKILKEKFEEISSLIKSLKTKPVNDPKTTEIIEALEKNVRQIIDENTKLKDELEQFKPLFNEEAPIIEASKLGEGSFGEVYKGVWKTQFAAIKKAFTNPADEKELAKIRKELKILKNLRSSYTIQYYGEYQKENDIYIIMEYAEHGSLTKFITDNKDKDHD
ncbi:6946_t:CDS:2 [Ambispora leptoticha]|uniref:mitogen-activated protein kinase kinase n=1 Tax=Ambispora leptoticha TaxID=144679 RepID=A0A9N8V0V1_9GLOM|nr:6946_t:CDS:2 [Ambispora leptoticha]